MPKYANSGRMSARINNYVKRNEGKNVRINQKIKVLPKEILKRIIVIMDSFSSKNSVDFIKLIINSNSVIDGIDMYNGPCKGTKIENTQINNLSELFQYYYDKGYRMFISTNNSSDTYTAFNWIKLHNDVIIFNTFSTVASDDFLINTPINLIRTSVHDLDMLRYFTDKVLNNFYKYISEIGNDNISFPLSNSEPNINPFSIIVYIYEPGIYPDGYLDNLLELIDSPSNQFNTEIVSIKLENGVLPELAKYYLTFNNISSAKYIDSLKKPLIIFNTENPNSLFSYLDDPKYYDNYTLLGDAFSQDTYKTNYKFTAAFVNIANFSDIGYRLSYLVDKEQSISPQVLNIYNILSQCGNIFMTVINKNVTTFDSNYFVNLLSKYFIVTNGDWTDKYVNVYKYISTKSLNTTIFENKFELLCSYHQWNPNAIVVYSASSTVLNYFHLTLGNDNDLKTYSQNIERIERMKSSINIDNFLDNIVEYYISDSNVAIYINFLESNHKNKFPTYMFTEYYIYKMIKKYKIPIIVPEPIVISKIISKDKYILAPGETNSNLEIAIQIPSAVYDTKVYYYDIITQQIIHILSDNYLQETYDAIDISLEDSSPSIKLHLYRGNLLNIGTYNENTNTFTTKEKIRGYISQNININWLIIETEYEIGDSIIVKETGRNGTVTGVSNDKYTITALLEDDTTDTTYDQPQITKMIDM